MDFTEKQITLAIAHCEKTISKKISLIESYSEDGMTEIVTAEVKGEERYFQVFEFLGKVLASRYGWDNKMITYSPEDKRRSIR